MAKKPLKTVERKKKKPNSKGKAKEGRDDKKVPKEPVPKDGDKTTTKERPKKHSCDCKSTNTYILKIGSALGVGPRRRPPLRIVITVTSAVTCDPATPGHCEYTYTASAVFQSKTRAGWRNYARRKPNIRKFAIKDPINSTETLDRIDSNTVTFGDWFPKAPKKEKVDIELKVDASNRGGWAREIKRKAEICVPKFDKPDCPKAKK